MRSTDTRSTPTEATESEVDLSRLRKFFDVCVDSEHEAHRKDPTVAMVMDLAREKLDEIFGVTNLSTIEGAWLRHITIATIRDYNAQRDLIAQGELIAENAIYVAPFAEIAMRWVSDLYRSDFLWSEELDNIRMNNGGVSETFKLELQLERALAHKL
jgi:hypothetical protein